MAPWKTWRGWSHAKIRDYARAVEDLTEAIRLDPTQGWLHGQRGRAHAKIRDYARAVEDLTEAIRLDPTQGWFHGQRGWAWNQNGEYARAIEDLTEAIRLDPTQGWFHGQRGRAHNETRDYARAVEDLTEAIRLDPTDGWWYGHRGRARAKIGDYARAVEDLTEAIRLDPTQGWFHGQRGRAHNETGDYARAIEDLNEAIRLEPTQGWFYGQRGRALDALLRNESSSDPTRYRLQVPRGIYRQMAEHANREAPRLCVGLLAGRSLRTETATPLVRADMWFPLVNAAPGPGEYESDPRSLIHAWRDMQAEGLDLVAIYHSVIGVEPAPSRLDIECNSHPEVMRLILPVGDEGAGMGAWWISGTRTGKRGGSGARPTLRYRRQKS